MNLTARGKLYNITFYKEESDLISQEKVILIGRGAFFWKDSVFWEGCGICFTHIENLSSCRGEKVWKKGARSTCTPGRKMYTKVSISQNSHDRIKQGKVMYGKIPGIWNLQKQHVLYMKEFLAKDSYFSFEIQFLGFVKMTNSRSKTDEVP